MELTFIKEYFIKQMRELVETEEKIKLYGIGSIPPELLAQAKKDGFSDRYLALLMGCRETEVCEAREALGVTESWEAVPVSGVEDASYYFSTYNGKAAAEPESGTKQKVMILGGGPNRIGQGIEFDYCCVHAAFTLRELGYETIMVNCNPETVSTDYDTSDRLYFEPLTVEDVMQIYKKEKPVGLIAQFGGQTPLNLAGRLEELGVNILGTSTRTIDLAEDRDHFRDMMERLGIPMPQSDMASDVGEALAAAESIGYPVMVRPSYVLGGAGMRIVNDAEALKAYMENAVGVSRENPILVDRFLQNAMEVEADAISDGRTAFVPAVMEHIEFAGVHSGDSACVIPSVGIPAKHLETIKEYTRRIAVEMGVKGLMNIQYAIAGDKVYILEANPRASRTVPLVSKVCNVEMVPVATKIIMSGYSGRPFDMDTLVERKIPHYGVKEAVFPFNMFPEVDPLLGPEMLSTGEVLGISDTFGRAFYKAQEAANLQMPLEGTVFISVNDSDKEEAAEVAKGFKELGFSIISTQGTARYLSGFGIDVVSVTKLHEGGSEIIRLIEGGEISMVINTPSATTNAAEDDSYIRKEAIKTKTPYFTTMPAAKAAVKGIADARSAGKGSGRKEIKSLQEYHREII